MTYLVLMTVIRITEEDNELVLTSFWWQALAQCSIEGALDPLLFSHGAALGFLGCHTTETKSKHARAMSE